MVTDIRNLDLLGDFGIPNLQRHYIASFGKCVSYDPRVGSSQESTPSLVVRIVLDHICNYVSIRHLHLRIGFHK